MKDNELTNQTHPLVTHEHLRRLAVIYIRQSTEDQVRENTGSTLYQRNLTAVAQAYGWQDSQIEVIDEDLGKSGSSSERRMGWQRLQDMIDAGQVGAVLVANISRLSRHLLDFELFRIRAALHNTLLHVDGRFLNPADSNDTIASQITAIVASFENRKRTEVMSQSRLAKAKRGEVVSRFPVGWVKGPDGKYQFDPQCEGTIRTVIDTFFQTRSIYRTVRALAKAGVQMPYRCGQRMSFRRPSACRVRRILINPNYAGTYVYAQSQSQAGGPVLASGHSKRVKLPEDRWIKNFNHHPAYMSQEQQEEVRCILKKNQFQRRDRPGRGRAPTQGLLRCAVCGCNLSISYPGKTYSYICNALHHYGQKLCTNFTSPDLDHCILREVFKVLEAPPIEMLKSALDASRTEKQRRLDWIQSERERLAHEQRVAEERADLTRGSLPRVHRVALENLEKVLQAKEQFEQRLALESLRVSEHESDEELEELCRTAGDVPKLWAHPAVTHQERKEILRCIIDHILIRTSNEKIDAIIFWKTGAQTPLFIWRALARPNLVRELHAKHLTLSEIKGHLAAGKTSTGQVVKLSIGRISLILKKLGLKKHRHRASYVSLGQEAAKLSREGRSFAWIAQHFNERGLESLPGKPWTNNKVRLMIRRIGEKAGSLESLHRSVIADARARGLDNKQTATELNQKGVRRKNKRAWTAVNVATRSRELSRKRIRSPESSLGSGRLKKSA
jgi:DNA invertase Pin-like site-specific DNA recombinase